MSEKQTNYKHFFDFDFKTSKNIDSLKTKFEKLQTGKQESPAKYLVFPIANRTPSEVVYEESSKTLISSKKAKLLNLKQALTLAQKVADSQQAKVPKKDRFLKGFSTIRSQEEVTLTELDNYYNYLHNYNKSDNRSSLGYKKDLENKMNAIKEIIVQRLEEQRAMEENPLPINNKDTVEDTEVQEDVIFFVKTPDGEELPASSKEEADRIAEIVSGTVQESYPFELSNQDDDQEPMKKILLKSNKRIIQKKARQNKRLPLELE